MSLFMKPNTLEIPLWNKYYEMFCALNKKKTNNSYSTWITVQRINAFLEQKSEE